MILSEYLTAVERLLTLPGPRTAELHVSEEFWEADAAQRVEQEEAFATDCDALVTLLSQRWGEAETLDLTGHLVRVAEGEEVPEPLRSLCASVGVLHRWHVDGRWIGVGVGQQASQLPLHLVAAVGEED